VVVLYVINYTYLYHHIVVLDKYIHSNLVYYKHNGDDEPYDILYSIVLSKNIKIEIYMTIILPVILCGCETW